MPRRVETADRVGTVQRKATATGHASNIFRTSTSAHNLLTRQDAALIASRQQNCSISRELVRNHPIHWLRMSLGQLKLVDEHDCNPLSLLSKADDPHGHQIPRPSLSGTRQVILCTDTVLHPVGSGDDRQRP